MTSVSADTRPNGGQRNAGLDALRGVAALIVVIHHLMLTSPVIADAYTGTAEPNQWWMQAILYSPLHGLWAGTEAVFVFFILSGIVLAMPAGHGRRIRWLSYYPSRLIRLYVPAVAALVLAFLSTLIVPRLSDSNFSSWVNAHAEEAHGVLQLIVGSTLMGGAGGLNTPLWSLRWEVLFSVLLPAYLVLAKWVQRVPIWTIGALIVVIGASTLYPVADGAFVYLPMFAIGVVMMRSRGRMEKLSRNHSSTFWAVLLLSGFVLLSSYWMLRGAGNAAEIPLALAAARCASVLGATLIVFIAWRWAAIDRFGNGAIPRWLATRSFSLYLVHEPIVIAGAILGATGAAPLTIVAVLLTVAFMTEAFYRLVERPGHMMARRVRQALH